MQSKKVLFITYDGLTDPLGQSQILPYLKGLSKLGHQIAILSCEKINHDFPAKRDYISSICSEYNIDWSYIEYTKKPPIFSTVRDLKKMKDKALLLHEKHKFYWVHCRTVLTTGVGFALQKLGAKMIFDIRGFWTEERVDGKLWNLSNPLYKLVYTIFKAKEAKAYRLADRIVTLTEAAQNELVDKFDLNRDNMAIVPCTADLGHFSTETVDSALKAKLKEELNLNSNLIIGYCGSLGTRYLIEEMLLCFKSIRKEYENAIFLIVTHSDTSELHSLIKLHNVESFVKLTSSSYEQIPTYISLMDLALYFIYAGNSGKAVSPTKQAEFLGMGVPIITNNGIGDSDKIIRQEEVGILVEKFNSEDYQRAAGQVGALLKLPTGKIIKVATKHFDLNEGISRYNNLYLGL